MKELQEQYKNIIADYIVSKTERNLYIGQNLIRQLTQKKITLEEVISIHKQAMEQIYPNLPLEIINSYEFLIEIMVHFGLTLKERASLLEQQEERRIEQNVATKMQNRLLKSTIPKVVEIDIGIVSIPTRRMNGHYAHFLLDENNYVSVAVTHVVGEGVAAALCMSMVKNVLDTLAFADNNPSFVLEVLNRVIEKSIDDSMFVSMFYGRYDIKKNAFTYGSAGHEPALYYSAEEDAFYTLESKGLLLGIIPEVKYPQFDIELGDADFIVMTDGVTKLRKNAEFNTREMIQTVALKNNHLSAQEMCEKLYEYLRELQEFGLEDDFTVVIFKK